MWWSGNYAGELLLLDLWKRNCTQTAPREETRMGSWSQCQDVEGRLMLLSCPLLPKTQRVSCWDKAVPLHHVRCYKPISALPWMVLSHLIIFFHHAFLTLSRGVINHMAQGCWGFPLIQPNPWWRMEPAFYLGLEHSLLFQAERWLVFRELCMTRLHTECSRLSLVGNEKDIDSFVSLTWS